ncbi:hypothetical protein GOP47_0000854 [Adiantum capillus-veneris]|uniref:Protein kinase domain-containing protein n=1 Tax=Adiantum capillus-veneris TaxID=13818 RepID=A0A9D4ZTG0_ADICA|nr:hypothetical protein GOP47_0000854 [Adiantum capillus-veneris]
MDLDGRRGTLLARQVEQISRSGAAELRRRQSWQPVSLLLPRWLQRLPEEFSPSPHPEFWALTTISAESSAMDNLVSSASALAMPQRLSVAFPREAAASHTVRLHQVIEDDTHVHLIIELCRGGELFERIVKKKCYAEAEAAFIIKHLMKSIQFCHRMGVMHRDVKPENILFLEESNTSPIKLADFGLALEFSPGKKFSGIAGSAYYIAPEVLEGEYSEEVDVWSTGVVLYVMLSGVPPFWGETDEDIFNAIREANLKFSGTSWNSISFSAKDLITRMLCADVKMRLTPEQVLEHPWILHHSKASENGSRKHQEALKNSTSISSKTMSNNCQVKSKRKVVPLIEPASASATACQRPKKKADSISAQDSSSMITQFCTTLAGLHPAEGNQQKSSLCMIPTSNNRSRVAPLTLNLEEQMKSTEYRDDESLQAMLIAKLNDTRLLHLPESNILDGQESRGWSSILRAGGNKTEQIFGLDIGKKRYLMSYMNTGREKGWRILGQCHKKVAAT